jgi:hypothetical protein
MELVFSNSKKFQISSFKKTQEKASVVNELVYMCINKFSSRNTMCSILGKNNKIADLRA